MTTPRPEQPETQGGGDEAPRRLRRAEAVLQRRTGRFLLVLEQCVDQFNQQAVLRTAEGFGLQHVWMIHHPTVSEQQSESYSTSVTRGAWRWLSLRRFYSTRACIEALREAGWAIWTTDLGSAVEEASAASLRPVPGKVALVMGRESDGVSREMHEAAGRRLRLPMQGFTESFNLTVASALLLQLMFDACPEARGDLSEAQKEELRALWYPALGGVKKREEYRRWVQNPPPPLDDLDPPPESRRPRVPRRLEKRLLARSPDPPAASDD